MIDLNGRLALDHELDHFLSLNGLNRTDIDILLLGYNSDINYDHVYGSFQNNLFPQTAAAWFKHLCGEYHTASGFGLYIAANVLKHQYLPEIIRYNQIRPEKLNRILIYNQFRNTNHSFILVERCR